MAGTFRRFERLVCSSLCAASSASLFCSFRLSGVSGRMNSSATQRSQLLFQPLKWIRYSGILRPRLSFSTTSSKTFES
uniref:Putative secreted protein n=1 Tax=Ixodes ricinus TaxID=34613 RepID=A0A6B0U5D3_IXORI